MAEQHKPIHPDDAKFVTRRQVLESGTTLGLLAGAAVALFAAGRIAYREVEALVIEKEPVGKAEKRRTDAKIAVGAAVGQEIFHQLRKTVKRNTHKGLERRAASRRGVTGETHEPPTEISG